jgi:hypothetical protein
LFLNVVIVKGVLNIVELPLVAFADCKAGVIIHGGLAWLLLQAFLGFGAQVPIPIHLATMLPDLMLIQFVVCAQGPACRSHLLVTALQWKVQVCVTIRVQVEVLFAIRPPIGIWGLCRDVRGAF